MCCNFGYDNIYYSEKLLHFAVNFLRFLYLIVCCEDRWMVNNELEIILISAVLAKSKYCFDNCLVVAREE